MIKKRLQLNPEDTASQGNISDFIMNSFLNQQAFLTLGMVVAVNTVAKEVNIKPLVHSTDPNNEVIEKEIIYGVPYFRLQRGTSAVIMNPVVGDIGLICTCDSDISNVKASKKASLPATKRVHNYSDSIYLGGIGSINQTPSQYVEFDDSGINITSPAEVNINAPAVNVNCEAAKVISKTVDIEGETTITGNLKVSGITTTSGLNAGAGGGTATFTGVINHVGTYNLQGNYTHINGTMYSLGRKVDGDHTHDYSSGGGTTQRPNA